MIMQPKKALAFLYLSLIPLLAFLPTLTSAAEGLSYSYFEFDYIDLDVDESDEDYLFQGKFDNGDGWGFRASLALGQQFFVYGAYYDTNADFSYTDNIDIVVPGDVDQLKFHLGIGVYLPMNANSDVVASIAYADIDYDSFDIGRNSDIDWNDLRHDPSDGYHFDISYRSQFTQILEGSIGVRYTDIQDVDGASVIGNLLFELDQNWGANLSVDAGDKLMTWGFGLRYSL